LGTSHEDLKHFYTVDSRTRYFVAQQQCKESPLLHFHGNNEHFYTADSNMYVNDYTEGRTVAFPCKQWLHERTTILYHIYYIANLVPFVRCGL